MSSSMSSRRRAALAATVIAATCLALPTVGQAKGGSGGGGGGGTGGGGGGTTTTAGVIKVGASAVAACNNGTNLSVSLGKGSGGRVKEVLVMSGNTGGYWMFRTLVDGTGQNVVSFGGNRSELGTASSITTVEVNSSLPRGTYALTFTGTRTALLPGAPIDASGALLETCSAPLTIVV
ncbi:MAG: hypothetical protein AB7V43_22010, partial [Acidimicrobiia bacterium]